MVAQRFTTCPTSCLSPRPRRQHGDCCVVLLTHGLVLTWRSAAVASKESLRSKHSMEKLQTRSNRGVDWGEPLDDNLETIKHRSHRMKLGFPACLTSASLTGCKSKLLLSLNKHDGSPMICWRHNGDFAASWAAVWHQKQCCMCHTTQDSTHVQSSAQMCLEHFHFWHSLGEKMNIIEYFYK